MQVEYPENSVVPIWGCSITLFPDSQFDPAYTRIADNSPSIDKTQL